MKISLVIPCYNESNSLNELHSKCVQLSKELDIEIIFVNNGSTDKTKEIFESYKNNSKNFIYLNLKK